MIYGDFFLIFENLVELLLGLNSLRVYLFDLFRDFVFELSA